ncbi:hypothetical protein CYLTODRAFT_353026 [Cylindrobasidium torrendii FP15055 ss-10]|uniref:Spc7 kinetochore protein domain-containing protein n=1 Tax=Cylindrobasidium torrendii FP15055 ss-10 TaxID=1314674 RepID=A0A0D7BAE5_9AGAR|nr:hypothetical protein CYLTODRAFT_353026 [Cylindrobasidium torrendii FP15055 ss-10]
MQMTGIQFMDNLRAPRKSVRSTKMSQIRPLENISLSEQAMAVLLELPQLMLYSRVGHELQEWITQNSEVYSKMEEEALEATPELFIEYARAEEDEQADLRQSLDIFRSNVRLQSRGAWYDWKHQWLTGIHATAQESRQEYEADVHLAESLRKQAEADTAALEADYEALSRQLEKEEAEVAELEGCNMEYLEELKSSLADQNGVIASLEAEVSQTEGNAAHLKEHLTQIQTEMKSNLDALTKAMGLLHVSKDKLERSRRETQPQSLQKIHMCVVTSYKPALFEYEYASQYRVRIPCSDFGKPIHDKIEIAHLERIQKDEFAPLNQTFLACANDLVREDTQRDLPGVATVLQNYVAACEQLRRQFIHLVIRFPLYIVPIPSGGFVAKAVILYPVLKSRVAVEFVFDPQTFSRWPCSVRSLQFDVKVAFGKADRTAIVKAIQDVLIVKTPTDNYACLTEACMEAAALWD